MQERLKAQKHTEIAIERANAARHFADEEEARLRLAMQDTVARRLKAAEAVHAVATGGLIVAIRRVDPDPVLLERLETPAKLGDWTHHNADRNREMYSALAPVLSDGLEALRQPLPGPRFLEGLTGFLRGISGWVGRLADASPRWLKWPETVEVVAQGAKRAFGSIYAAPTLAKVVEDSPAWQAFTSAAEAQLSQARAVQALTRPDVPGAGSHPHRSSS